MANPPGLIGDQSQATTDQGFLPGLLGKVRDFFPDPAAAYGGLLSDEATRRAFAWRELGAAAGAFSQGAMPVPYKGGIPFGATLGAAGAAASSAGDSLIQARLQQAQADLAQQQAAVAHGNVGLLQALPTMLKNYYGADGQQGGGGAGGATPLTGPAKIIAGGGGSIAGGVGGSDNAEIRTNNFAGMRVPGAAPGGPNTNPAGWQKFDTPEAGVQAISNQLDRYAAGKTTGTPLTTIRGIVSTWAPPSENDTGALINRASTIMGVDPDTPLDLSNPTVKARLVETMIRNEQGGNLHPNAAAAIPKVFGLPDWQPYGSKAPQTAAAPPDSASPPAAAPPPGGLLRLPEVPTHNDLAPAPAAATGTPGPTGLLTPQPGMLGGVAPVSTTGGGAPGIAPQGMPPEGIPMPGRLGGMGPLRGGAPPGLLSVADTGAGPGDGAGPNLVPGGAGTNLPPQAPVTAGPPPPQSAAIRSLLEPLQPAPTATPYTNAPPVTGQGAPAPGPAAPVQTSQAPSAAASAPASPQATAIPGVAGIPSPQKIAQAQQIAFALSVLGKAIPPDIAETAKFPMAVALANATQQARVGPQIQIDTAQQALITQREVLLKQLQAGYDTVEVPVRDAQGNYSTVTMTRAQAGQYLGHVNAQLTGASPGAGGAMPAAGAPGAMPAGKPFYTPAQEEQLRGTGKVLADEYGQVVTDADTGQKAKPYLLSIQQALQTFSNPGAGAADKLAAVKGLQGAFNTAGLQLSPELQDWIAKGEVVSKSGTQLGFELARSLGPHESQMIVQQAIQNNPGIGTSLQGNKDLTNLMGAIIDRNQAKRDFYDDWYTNHNNSYQGAQTAFNKANPWEVTVSQFAPYQADKIDARTFAKLPDGVRILVPNKDGTWTDTVKTTTKKPGGQ